MALTVLASVFSSQALDWARAALLQLADMVQLAGVQKGRLAAPESTASVLENMVYSATIAVANST